MWTRMCGINIFLYSFPQTEQRNVSNACIRMLYAKHLCRFFLRLMFYHKTSHFCLNFISSPSYSIVFRNFCNSNRFYENFMIHLVSYFCQSKSILNLQTKNLSTKFKIAKNLDNSTWFCQKPPFWNEFFHFVGRNYNLSWLLNQNLWVWRKILENFGISVFCL